MFSGKSRTSAVAFIPPQGESRPGTTSLQSNVTSDAGLLVFASERDDDREIYLRDMHSLAERRLTNRPGRDGYPKLSSDSSRVAFHRAYDGKATAVVVLDLASGQESVFTCSQVR